MRWLAAVTLAAFLMAGDFKTAPALAGLPFDLTLLLAAATAGLTLWAWLRSRLRLPRALLSLGLLYVLLAVPLLWTQLHGYAADKVGRLFTLTLLATLAPPFLMAVRPTVRRFLHAFLGLGLVLGLVALPGLLTTGRAGQLTAFGTNPISLGRAAGLSLIWTAVLAIEGQIHPLRALAGTALFGVLLLAAGARGPLLAAPAALLLLGLVSYWRDPGRRRGFTALILLLAAALGAGLVVAPAQSSARVLGFLRGEPDTSGAARLTAYRLAWEQVREHPLGLGWGGFARAIDLWGGGAKARQYPHNLLLETALEAGWLPALWLLGLIGAALWRLLRLRRGPEVRAVFALLVFFLLNALVSGDLNDNRTLLALVGVALAPWSDHGQ